MEIVPSTEYRVSSLVSPARSKPQYVSRLSTVAKLGTRYSVLIA